MLRFLAVLMVALAACKSSTFPDDKTWRLRALEGQAVPDSIRTTLQFDAKEKAFRGAAACNSYSGTYTLDGERLSFGAVMSTKRFCEAMPWESRYFGILPRVAGYRHAKGQLELLDSERKVLARLEQ